MAGIHWLNGFDTGIELFLNGFMGRNAVLDRLMAEAVGDTAVKAGVIVFLIWVLLFNRGSVAKLGERFELLLGALIFSILGTFAARGLALAIPFRSRPYSTPGFPFHAMPGVSQSLVNWSSFPSDHAVLFFTLACGILMVSHRAGWFALAWVSLVVCLPRLYLGVHWPTDILAGAAMGVGSAQVARVRVVRERVRHLATYWYEHRPGLFLAVLFAWSYETINIYDDLRHVLRGIRHLVR